MPLVSVIMGVYNSQSLSMLKRSIDSILNQSFRDFEFIICNDCSTKEGIISLLKQKEKDDKRIVLIHNSKNCGLARTLNNCLIIAKGEYIARQDDDDVSLPNRLKKEVDFLEKHKDIDLVGCNLLLIDENKIWGKQILKKCPNKKDLLFGCVFSHPTLLMRKKMLFDLGLYSVGKYISRTEDYDLYCKMFEKNFTGINLQDYYYLYYQTSITYSKQKFSNKIDEYHLRKIHFKLLNILHGHILYLFKPLLSGIIPQFIKRMKKRHDFSLKKEESKLLNNKYQKYIKGK